MRRTVPRTLLVLILLLGVALTSEFLAYSWFSPVILTPSPHQRFFSVSRGEVRFGTRGTGGFFSRYIPPAGAEFTRPNRIASDERARFFIPRTFSRLQTHGYTIPLHTLSVILFMFAVPALIRRRARPGHCPRCHYDLGGLTTTTCPECGAKSPTP